MDKLMEEKYYYDPSPEIDNSEDLNISFEEFHKQECIKWEKTAVEFIQAFKEMIKILNEYKIH